ncbi:MAG: hypothetical protein GQ532_12000 [Methylomarinum sp.]|nr:hypothetical protein [Methylomarinum sp.]
MNKLRLFFVLCIAISTGLLSGCAKYYALTTEYVAENSSETLAEVVSTPNYKRILSSIKTVAVQAPDYCIDETKTQKDGTRAESTILKTECGIEMGEIERGWAKFGYEVLSWKVLIHTQKSFNLSPREAAKKLGADAILLVNSTERGEVHAGADARWERRYFESNKHGNQAGSAYVDSMKERQFIRLLGGQERKLFSKSRLSVTINTSVVLVSTGKAVWFYEWTHAEKKQVQTKGNLHVICEKDYCRPAPKLVDSQRATHLSSGNSEALSTQKTPHSQRRAIHTRLMKEVINDMVNKFSSGTA